jgi:hypothetical protein
MAWKGTQQENQWQVRPESTEEEHESHEPPRGALLITCGYLVLICSLWLQVYLQLISNGGVPRP